MQKQRVPKNFFDQFRIWLRRKSTPENRVHKRTKTTGEFKKLSRDEGIQKYSIVSETKAAFAERIKRSLRINLTVKKEIMDTSTFTKGLNSSQPWMGKKVPDRLDIKECQEVRLFVHSVQQATTRIKRTQIWNPRQSSHLKAWVNLQEGL